MQKEEEKKFKEVGEAFSVLSDAKKKSRYDSGQDLEDDGMNMGGQHLGKPWGGRSRGWTDWSTSPLWANEPPFLLANSCFYGESLTGNFSVTMLLFFLSPPDFDANNIFKAFFGGPGGFSFEGNSCM